MADLNTPLKGVAFDLGFTLYKSDGSVIANPGTLTKKISKDFGDYADIGTVTEEDTTYGQLKAALTTSEMNADVVMVYVKDDTSGCVPFTATIYPAAAAPASAAATAVWGAETKALTDKAGFTLTAAYDAAKDDVLTPLAVVDGVVDAILADTGTDGVVVAAGSKTGYQLAADQAVNATKIGGTAQTGRDLGASVLISSGTGAGQLDVTSGVVKANLTQILGTVLTETAGYIAAAFKQFFNVSSPSGTMKAITNVVTTTNLTNIPAASMRTAVGLASANLDTQLGDLPTNSELATALAGADDAVLAAIPSAATVASQVRTELATELARIDAAITTRLAAAGYTAPDNAGIADIPTNSELASALAAADDAVLSAIAALNDFDPAADTVAHVTLVDTTTTNTDMVSAAPTAAGVADAVWDEALAGHAAAGSAGEALAGADAPSASDNATAVWSAGTRTLTSAGSGGATAQEVWEYATRALTDKAGFTLTAAYEAAKTAAGPSDVASALGTYDAPTKAELDSGLAALNDVSTAEVNAACDSAIADAALATAADLATVDGVADSIKAKTDNLPTDPADQSLIEAAIAGISIPAPTVDFTEVLAAIAAIGESGVEVDMSGVLDALAVLQASLGAANITVTAPVAASGTVTLYQGDDYDAAHGRGVAFAYADETHALGLDAVGAVVSFKCAQATWTGTATETEAGYTLVFEPTAAQTGALTMRRQGYEVEAVLADGDVVTLATGTLAVERDVPSVG